MGKKGYRALFRRGIFVTLLLLAQMAILVLLVEDTRRRYIWMGHGLTLLSLLTVLYIISRQDTAGYKLTWSVLILAFPVFGGLFYLLYRLQSSTARLKKQFFRIQEQTNRLFFLPGDSLAAAKAQLPQYSTALSSLQEFSGFPVFDRTETEYYPGGESKFAALIRALQAAEKYIFLEYFIVAPGKMWNTISDILTEKAKSGVEVRFMYDDMGSLFRMPAANRKILEENGIRCMVFNPFRPFLTTVQNNRDHRKIAVIDGKIAFTGGVNLADEYINHIRRFGKWRDAAISLKGAAAWSMTVMFLQMWALASGEQIDYEHYYPYRETPCTIKADGFVQPYADSPLDTDHVSERVYMQIITGARKYLYISTPYLIIDDSMLSAMITAAQSGVDVRIMTPHIWDKRLVHLATRSYYRELTRGGVKIYAYTPGFNHAKTFVSDDEIATVGTVNLDFRSLFLHFECGAEIYGTKTVKAIRKDFEETMACCHEIRESDCKAGAVSQIAQSVLRLFAPLL